MRRNLRPRAAMLLGTVVIVALIAGMTGTAGAFSAGGLSQASSNPGASAAKAKRGPRGKRGKTGKTGATGPAGPAGPAGPSGKARVILDRSNTGTALHDVLNENGLRIQADCTGNVASARSTADNGIVNVSGVAAGNIAYNNNDPDFDVNDFVSLVPPAVTGGGTLSFASAAGAVETFTYQVAFGTAQGDCVLSGTLLTS